MVHYKELLEGNKPKKREDLEGVKADKLMRDIEKLIKKKELKSAVHIDDRGYEIHTIMGKDQYYIAYYGYGDELMRLVVNPNSKDMDDMQDLIDGE